MYYIWFRAWRWPNLGRNICSIGQIDCVANTGTHMLRQILITFIYTVIFNGRHTCICVAVALSRIVHLTWNVKFQYVYDSVRVTIVLMSLTLNTLTWKIYWVPNNTSRWQMGFNSAFKGLRESRPSLGPTQPPIQLVTEFFPVGKAAGEWS